MAYFFEIDVILKINRNFERQLTLLIFAPFLPYKEFQYNQEMGEIAACFFNINDAILMLNKNSAEHPAGQVKQ